MTTTCTSDPAATNELLRHAAQGDQVSWRALLARYGERLHRMVGLRLDRRLQRRIDPSDVLQEAYVEAWSRLAKYLRQPTMPFYPWLRFLTGQKLLELHRHHLGVRMRAAGREIGLSRRSGPESSSASLAALLLGREPRPSEIAVRAETQRRLRGVLDSMDPLDREILALRHFEQLSNAEAASLLELEESAASKRYIRAVKRLKEILASLPGGLEELQP